MCFCSSVLYREFKPTNKFDLEQAVLELSVISERHTDIIFYFPILLKSLDKVIVSYSIKRQQFEIINDKIQSSQTRYYMYLKYSKEQLMEFMKQ